MLDGLADGNLAGHGAFGDDFIGDRVGGCDGVVGFRRKGGIGFGIVQRLIAAIEFLLDVFHIEFVFVAFFRWGLGRAAIRAQVWAS